MLELGASQGRDTRLAEQGFDVHALDYAASALEAIEQKMDGAGLSAQVTVAQRHSLEREDRVLGT